MNAVVRTAAQWITAVIAAIVLSWTGLDPAADAPAGAWSDVQPATPAAAPAPRG